MNDAQSIWQWLHDALKLFFRPVTAASARGSIGFKELLGAAADTISDESVQALSALAGRIATFVEADSAAVSSSMEMLVSAGEVIDAWRTLSSSGAISSDVQSQLVEYLTLQCMWNASAKTHSALTLFGIVDEMKPPGQRLISRNIELLWRPKNLLSDVYGWGTSAPGFNAEVFLRRVGTLARSFGAPVAIVSGSTAYHSLDRDVVPKSNIPTVLLVPLVKGLLQGVVAQAGCVAVPFPGKTPDDSGIAVVPYGLAAFPEGNISSEWTISLKSRCDENFGLVLRPSGVKIAKLDPKAQSGRIEAAIERRTPWLLELGDGFSISAKQAQVALDVDLGTSFDAKFKITELAVTIAAPDTDGFLANALPAGGFAAKGDVTVGWSPDAGLHFAGGARFRTSIPLHLVLGPVTLSRLALGIDLGESPILTAGALVDVSAQIGPIATAVEGVGIRCEFDTVRTANQSDQFTFGPLRAAIAFVPPTGVGLSVNGGPISGSGALRRIDTGYEGGLALRFETFSLSAFAILETKLPSGQRGYSFLASIFGEFDAQLGMGFRLTGVGGLIGLHRTASTEVLRKVLREGNLDGLLFPANPIQDSAQILNTMASVFPAREGQHVLGPCARINWGTPTLIQAKVGIILEVGDSTRVLILGQIGAILPNSKAAILCLNIDFVGLIDFDTRKIALDATLANSTLLDWPLTGDMALRTGWGEDADFLLSVGGFHPQFAIPANFPSLQRFGISFGNDKVQASLAGYFAITSNTAQMGARIDVYAQGPHIDWVGQFDARGQAYFDALCVFNPFAFDAALGLSLALLRNGDVLCAIGGDVRLRGPNPYRLNGKVWVEVCHVTVKVPISGTFGQTKPEEIQTAVRRQLFLRIDDNYFSRSTTITF